MLLYLALIAGCMGTVLIAWLSIPARNIWTYAVLVLIFFGAAATIKVTYDSDKSTQDLIDKSNKISQLSLKLYSSSARLAASQSELKGSAEKQADSQKLLREKSNKIASLYLKIAESQNQLRQKSDEISIRNTLVSG